MTLTEYLNQGDWPVRCPNVILQEGEYEVGAFSGAPKHQVAWASINGMPYSYCIKEGSTTIWTCDEDGSPRSVTVFSLPNDFFTKVKINDKESRIR